MRQPAPVEHRPRQKPPGAQTAHGHPEQVKADEPPHEIDQRSVQRLQRLVAPVAVGGQRPAAGGDRQQHGEHGENVPGSDRVVARGQFRPSARQPRGMTQHLARGVKQCAPAPVRGGAPGIGQTPDDQRRGGVAQPFVRRAPVGFQRPRADESRRQRPVE